MKKLVSLLPTLLAICCVIASAQTETATVSGRITDPQGAVVSGADVQATDIDRNVTTSTKTNPSGIYVIPSLLPGNYRLTVTYSGFKQIVKTGLTLHVQDTVAQNFAMEVGSTQETVTVTGGAPLVNTESGAVSTVIDSNFVQALPLNGRSFNTLLQLTPGVVIAQRAPNFETGQFSIAGQRTSANNFVVDGVSANFGVLGSVGIASGTGTQQAFSALGGTSSLVSVEDLQEFRIETSSFAPEFGRSPGGQVILTTRSGTNDVHGGVYEYFRNDVLDANNWLTNRAGKPRAPERYNDFGGFFGGPIRKDKTFFFISFEGIRLRQPGTTVVQVPSEFARTTAPAPIAPFIDAYPQPDDRMVTPGVYSSQLTGNFSNPSTLNAGSVRIDHRISSRFSIFGRYNEAPSNTAVRNNGLSEVDNTDVGTRTITVGTTMLLSPSMSNSLRGNYSMQKSSIGFSLDAFGGAVPPSLSVLAPSPLDAPSTQISFFTFDTSVYQAGPSGNNRSIQLNFADDLSWLKGSHQLKFGSDYRVIFLDERPFQHLLDYLVPSVRSFLSTGQALFIAATLQRTQYRTQAVSVYGQDTWKINPRLTMTYGLRWEMNPAPAARSGTTLAAWQNVDNPTSITLAPPGTSLWSTTYTDFAPRLGIAYKLRAAGDFVLRGGGGIFYDLASDAVGLLGSAFPNDKSSPCCPNVSLPLGNPTAFLPVLSAQPPFSGNILGFSPNLKLPRSYQWNIALEKSFPGQQAISVTYLGQAGRNLLRKEALSQPNANFAVGSHFQLTTNDAFSNYHALQVQYRRPLAKRLQALLNYTWSHSLDNATDDAILAVSSSVISAANDYASSSFDVRHTFSGALTYALPSVGERGPLAAITRDWSVQTVVIARSGFPFNAVIPSGALAGVNPRPNLVSGQPVWISDPSAPGGQRLNQAAFVAPPAGQQGNEGRNGIPGFGLTQVDLSLGRRFPIGDRLHLQFKTDAFNLFNHPNFTNPFAFIGLGASFLQASSTLNRGLGGLNPLFQEGGPRSLQLSLKLEF